MKRTLSFFIILGLLFGLTQPRRAGASVRDMLPTPAIYSFKPLSSDFSTGHVTLEFSLTPFDSSSFAFCKELEVTMRPQDGIRYAGEEHWVVIFENAKPISKVLELDLPFNDTSAIYIDLLCAKTGDGHTVRYYFVNTADSIEFWNGDPRDPGLASKFPKAPPEEIDFDTLKESDLNAQYDIFLDLRTNENVAKATAILGFEPTVDSNGIALLTLSLQQLIKLADDGLKADFVSPPPWSRKKGSAKSSNIKVQLTKLGDPNSVIYDSDSLTPSDSIVYPQSNDSLERELIPIQLDENEAKRFQKEQLEKEPLTDKPVQSLFIDGELWQRHYGETYFHKIEPITDTDAFLKRMQDSLRALPEDHLFDICLTLSENNEIASAQEVIGVLPNPLDSLYYHVKLTKKQINELVGKKIRIFYINNGRCLHNTSKNDSSEDSAQKKSPSELK